MNKYFLSLFFLCSENFHFTLIAHTDVEKNKQTENCKSVRENCTLKIMHEKLLRANNPTNIASQNLTEITTHLQNLYQECQEIINSPDKAAEQRDYTQTEWVHKSLREIQSLQQDSETLNCFNHALDTAYSLQKNSHTKNSLNIFEQAEHCNYQQALKVSRPYLEAQIKKWDAYQGRQNCDIEIKKTYLEIATNKNCDATQILQNVYALCNLSEQIKFSEFKENMAYKVDQIKGKPEFIECLQDFINFHAAFYNATTDSEKEKLKELFSIRYLQCRNK